MLRHAILCLVVHLGFVCVVSAGVLERQNDGALCTKAPLISCLNSWVQRAGIPLSTGSVHSLAQLNLDLFSYIMRPALHGGRARFVNMCQAGRGFIECMGGDDAATNCFTIAHLQAIGFSQLDALIGQVFYTSIHFTCNTPEFSDNWRCIHEQRLKMVNHQQECIATAHEQLQQDPTHKCQHVHEYVNCRGQPYIACGAAVSKVMCKHIQLHNLVFNIPINCPVDCDAL